MPLTLRSACSTALWFGKHALLLIPVYLVVILVGADWYIFVVQWGIQKKHDSNVGAAILCLVFTFVVVMILWSYARTILTSSSVVDNPPPADYYAKLRQLLPGQPERVCTKCDGPKPLRTHHCSICGKCILKMDHHCPWVATCVGFKNYKYFCLFVMWGCVGCSLYLIAGIQLIRSMFDESASVVPGFMSLLTSLLTAAFAISLLFFSGFHLHLVFTGQSTIEASLNRRNARRAGATEAATRGVAQRLAQSATDVSHGVDLEAQRVSSSSAVPADPADFSAGSRRENWEAVFGTDPWLWFLPVDTLHETGYEFDFLFVDEEADAQREMDGHDARHHSPQMQSARAAPHTMAHAVSALSGQHVALSMQDDDEGMSLGYDSSRKLSTEEDEQTLHLNEGGPELEEDDARSPDDLRLAQEVQYPSVDEERQARSSLVRHD